MSDKEPKGYGRRIKDAILSVVDVVKEHPVKVVIGVGVVLVLIVVGC